MRGGRSPARRAGRCRGSRLRCGTEPSTPLEWSYAPYETSNDALATGDDLQWHQPDRHPPRGIAVMAADGDDERLAGRGFLDRLAGGAGEPRLSRAQPVPVAASLLSPETGRVTWDRPRPGGLASAFGVCRRISSRW